MMDFDKRRMNSECKLRSWWERESHFWFNRAKRYIYFLFWIIWKKLLVLCY